MNYENMDKEALIKLLRHKDFIIKRLYLEKVKLNYYASVDTMTDVLNRRSGLELLTKEFNLAKSNNENFVICFVDVDQLKMINDNFGHIEGDDVLISVAKILRESIRETDFVIRMGGDEFLLVLPKTTMKEANKVWHKICTRVEKINKNKINYKLSISYGFYEYRKEIENKMSINDLIEMADIEMYKKKQSKKGILRIYVEIIIKNLKLIMKGQCV